MRKEKKAKKSKKRIEKILGESFIYKLIKTTAFQKTLIAIVVGVIVAFILSPDVQIFVQHYTVGDVASRDIKASQDLLVEDVASTLKKRKETGREQRSIYDHDEEAMLQLEWKVNRTFDLMRAFYGKWGGVQKVIEARKGSSSETSFVDPQALLVEAGKKQDEFQETIGFEVSDYAFLALEIGEFAPMFEDIISQLLGPIFEARIVGNKELLLIDKDKGIIVGSIQTKKEKIVKGLESLYDLKDARKVVEDRTQEIFKNLPATLFEGGVSKHLMRDAILEISQKLLIPNLTLNRSATEEKRVKAIEGVKPVYFQVKKGEIIVREGERVTEEDLLKLQASIQAEEGKRIPFITIGGFVLALALFYTFYNFSLRNIRKFYSNPKDLLLLGLVLIGILLLIRLGTFIGEAVAANFPLIPSVAYTYAIPVAAGVMIIRLFLNSETSLVFAAVVSILAGVLLENNLFFATYFFVGGLVAAGEVRYCTQRATIIKAGLFVGLVNMLLLLTFGLLMEDSTLRDTLLGLPFGLIGGIITAVIVTGVTPIIEVGFGYTTNIKLLELSRMDHPLLKELALQAPGTYHHSMVISNLVEASAEAINANPLLAKVSAFYHDIGKMKKSHYFIENQMGEENKHERLIPSMSALILISHVKEGVELAKEYKLGKEIIDIIKEHHGNSLITYFYQKAKKKEDPEVHEVKEKDFRYPGPKPQTKEVGLVMLADAVEAAGKSIPNPTPAKIKGVVQKIINKIFTDGQLDECELTLKDLTEIAKCFNRVLQGILHQRIVYPEPAYITDRGPKERHDEGVDKRRSEKDNDKLPMVGKVGSGGIKRLRIT